MDFLRIIRSLEDLLYEVIAWLVFYPRTLWRVLVHPGETMRYSDAELSDAPDEQYADTISPPLFLMLTVLLAHGLGLGLGTSLSEPRGPLGRLLLDSEQNLLLMRSLLFSIYALVTATTLLRHRGSALDRKTLRGPFYAQCYLTAPFALGISCAAILVRQSPQGIKVAGVVVFLGSVIWYLWVQTRWFVLQLHAPTGRAVLIALWCFVRAAAYNAAINMLLLTMRR